MVTQPINRPRSPDQVAQADQENQKAGDNEGVGQAAREDDPVVPGHIRAEQDGVHQTRSCAADEPEGLGIDILHRRRISMPTSILFRLFF